MKLLPHDEKFYDLFVEQSQILVDATKALSTGDPDAVRRIETQGDQKMRVILDRLNKTFITPIDPEDVSVLTTRIETLVDQIETLAFRLSLANGNACRPSEKLTEAAETIAEMFRKLQRDEMKSKDSLITDCGRVRELICEVIADARKNLQRAYETEKDPIAFIRAKDSCDWTEATARGFEQFSETLQTVLSKNA